MELLECDVHQRVLRLMQSVSRIYSSEHVRNPSVFFTTGTYFMCTIKIMNTVLGLLNKY